MASAPRSLRNTYANMADKRPSLSVKFGPLTLSYPHLNAPDEKFGESYYKADGVDEPNSAAMKQAKKILADAIKTFGLDADDCKLPLSRETIKDPNAPAGTKKPKRIETGKLVLKGKTKKAPILVDANARPINPKAVEIGGGSRAIIEGFLSPYNMKGDDGISFTVTGVQIIKLVEKGGGSSFTKYEGDEDAYVYDGAAGDSLNIGSDSDDDDDQSQDDGGVLDI
jgi:hypothetical protein